MLKRRLLEPRANVFVGPTLFRMVVIPVLCGVVVGGVILGYLIYSKSPAESRDEAQIILPDIRVPQQESPAPLRADEPEGDVKVEFLQVMILDTPTGYLNVRSGPGTNYEKITQVKPGERYLLISHDQNAGWYQIRLSETQTGWVTGEYAEIE